MTLYANLSHCEFGWYLCRAVPVLRRESRKYKYTFVTVQSRFEYFVRDFADQIIGVNLKGRRDRWLLEGKKAKKTFKGDWFIPNKKNIYKKGEYIKYGAPGDKYDVVIHARAEKDYGSETRNWSPKKYAKVVKLLGVNACSIGSKDGAYYVDGTKDLRGIDIEKVCNTIYSSSVVIGASSFPLHLASHCNTPHIVLTGMEYQKSIKGTNADRYKKLWNPFGTRCSIIKSWQPDIKDVIHVLRGYL